MTIKRISCILMVLVMVLALTACGSSSSSTFTTAPRITQNALDIDTLADAKRANFPDPTEGYALSVAEAGVDKDYLDKYLGKQIAAYENLKDEKACEYIFDLNKDMNSYMTSWLSLNTSRAALLRLEGTDEATAKADQLNEFNLTLSAVLGTWAEWDVKYQSIGLGDENAPSYDELMEAAEYVINQTSNLLYGKDMIR